MELICADDLVLVAETGFGFPDEKIAEMEEGDGIDIVEAEPGVKVEYVPKFCYLGVTLGSGGVVEEAARARVRYAWSKFKVLYPILTDGGAS